MFGYVFKMYNPSSIKEMDDLKEYYTLKSIKNSSSLNYLPSDDFNFEFIETLSKDKEFIKNLKRFVFKDIKEAFRIIGDFVIDLIQKNPNNRGILLNDYFSENIINELNNYYYNLNGKYGDIIDYDKLYTENSDILLRDIQFNTLEGLVFQYNEKTYKYTGSFMLLNRYSKRFSKN